MSDKEIEVDDVSAAEGSELTKEERLEAARKKYEELKKKKAKKAKKKAKKKTDDSPAPEDDNDNDNENENDVEVKDKDTKEETPADESGTTEEVVESKEEPKDSEPESPKETESKGEPEPVQEPQEPVKEPEQSESVPEPTKEADQEQAPESIEHSSAATPADIVTPSDIQKFKDTIAQQEKTIKKLRDENTDLKLSQMDMKDQIAKLESTIQSLRQGGGNTESVTSAVQSPKKKIEPAKPIFTSNEYASGSQPDFADFNKISDFRERLMVWKHWQVDMTNWHSTYATEKVSF